MSEPMYRIRGTLSTSRGHAVGGRLPFRRLVPGRARDGAGDIVEVGGETVVRVELDNGFALWSRVDDLSREYGTPPAGVSRDAGDAEDAWEFSRLTPQRASGSERGMAGLAIRVLDFFGVDVVADSARKLGKVFEEKQLGDHPPGVYRLALAGAFRLQAIADEAPLAADAGPLLLFLHGTASSTEGSFGKLWDAANTEGARLRQALAPLYGERVFACEHRTLSESPVANALALARRLPAGAEVHLVSHSRGGLVGELLALSGCAGLAGVLTAERLQTLFAADRTLAPQLGLAPLADIEASERDAAYAADRQRLGELVALLAEKKLRVTRFVRVACPARGTTLASGRLDRWLSVLDYLVDAATGHGLFGDGLDFLLAVVKERTDPRTLPGLEAMMPGSALTRLLNGTPELLSTADLSVIAGDIAAGDGLWNTLKVLASDWFYRNEHDLVVDTGSMDGGLPRPANGARLRKDAGPRVNHFRYFSNEQSVRWLRAGLLRSDGDNAGFQPATVIAYQLNPGNDRKQPERKRLDFVATREGDGTVSWQSGRLPGVPVWYVANTAHDALCAQPKAFPGYLDLLVNGQTTLLPAQPPAAARAAGQAEHFVLPPLPVADGIPAAVDLAGFGFSGSGPLPEESGSPATPTIEVSIRHGNLAYARHPVVVGHYQGDTVVSAEAVLDKQLGGALTRRLDLGIYPGALGSNTVFLNDSPNVKPGGAIVVGLGQVGGLSPGLLEDSLRTALLDFALDVAHWPDKRFGDDGGPRSAAVTCLLIGTGAGGLPVGDALEAILRAAVAANRRLAEQELDGRVRIDRLEFLELYEDIAIAAAEALSRILQNATLAAAVRWPAGAVETAQAGRRRVRFEQPPEWYQRLEIAEDAGRLRFIFTTDRARAEETLATGQLALVDSFVRIASRDTGQNAEVAKTLFEMLLPLRLRELSPQQGNLLVMVDRQSARYPWELLENRWATGERPPAVAAGFVRQFRTIEFRQRPAHGSLDSALVIGNPDLAGTPDFADLPGAREEAQQVVEQLAAADYDVTDCIDQPATPIMEALHKNSWRILHLAGHGVHEYARTNAAAPEKTISGMVIGADSYLTAGDIAQMRFVPELVFVNCCHLGRVDGARDFDRLGLAANLGEEFIRMGVRAVIAAGWAVDDRAGQTFAATFYRAMLAGTAFGEAVRSAREAVWTRCPDVNTWGAYQCYGDPDFRFHRQGAATKPVWPNFCTPHELVAELENLAADFRAGGYDEAGGRIARRLARIPPGQSTAWLQRADVCAALGLAWGEIRNWEEATRWLAQALAAERGECPLRALEQYANYRVRRAAARWPAARRLPAARRETARRQAIEAITSAIGDLDLLCQRLPTAERLSLLGGAFKRLAQIERDGERRQQALARMAEHYELAYARQRDAYAFTNRVAALLLANRGTVAVDAENKAKLLGELDGLQQEVARRNTDDPNFWDGASLADLALTRLLLSAAGPARQRDAGFGEAATAVVAAYRAAIARAASPRELASPAENIAFLSELWSARDKAMQQVFQSIAASLQ